LQISDRSLHVDIMKPLLDRLYLEFNYPDSAVDPIQIVRRYRRRDDREVVGFLAASLAFGRVASVLQSLERVVAVLGSQPAAYVRQFDPRRDGPLFAGIVHRWTRGEDVAALISLMRQMIERSGSIERFFIEGDDESGEDVGVALENFSRRALGLNLKTAYGRIPRFSRRRPGVGYFFPRPSAGSGCKRLNLFLRWMVRDDALDLGVWCGVPPSKLIVPLDTHVIRVGRCLGLTRYTSPGWQMARDITASLRRLDPHDPVKYDFALCHIGMMNACVFNRAAAPRDPAVAGQNCPLNGVCRPNGHTRRPSLRPSARR
jgi:uncharacterized protein (TIGR02757 family)